MTIDKMKTTTNWDLETTFEIQYKAPTKQDIIEKQKIENDILNKIKSAVLVTWKMQSYHELQIRKLRVERPALWRQVERLYKLYYNLE